VGHLGQVTDPARDARGVDWSGVVEDLAQQLLGV